MNVQYAYACFYLVHTLVARLQDKGRSRLRGGGTDCKGLDKKQKPRKSTIKNLEKLAILHNKKQHSRRTVREEGGWTDTEQTHNNQDSLIQWI